MRARISAPLAAASAILITADAAHGWVALRFCHLHTPTAPRATLRLCMTITDARIAPEPFRKRLVHDAVAVSPDFVRATVPPGLSRKQAFRQHHMLSRWSLDFVSDQFIDGIELAECLPRVGGFN